MYDAFIELIRPVPLLFYIFAYGLSATPTSYLVLKIIHKREFSKRESHAHSATYLWQTAARWSAILVFALDLLKGLIPCAIALSLEVPLEAIAMIGFFSVLGHCFSLWLGFSGGNGGVTAAGSMLIIFWPAAIANFTTNALLILIGSRPALASVIGSLVGACVIFGGLKNKVVWLVVAAMVMAIVIRHLSFRQR
jgi:glycerol-3-phosphate acyltransferase PlsY